jgi:hypothetical protein
MKVVIIIAVVVAIVFGVVSVFSSTLNPPEYQTKDVGVTGPLALGAISKVNHRVQLWHQPLESFSSVGREKLRAEKLHAGETFKVLNHVTKGSILWVEVQSLDDTDKRGYFKSPADDPVRATRVK